jgi:hypothetical protein
VARSVTHQEEDGQATAVIIGRIGVPATGPSTGCNWTWMKTRDWGELGRVTWWLPVVPPPERMAGAIAGRSIRHR